ncbi:MAG: glycosyltransferase [Saprospiraceae bacterium]|nr:glycosyltransferase [Saprospiraceae bacterium]
MASDRKLKSANPNVRGVKFRRNYGKSAGLNVGFEHTSGDVIITMDADLQDSPEEIPELYRMIKDEDLISFQVGKRRDMTRFPQTIPTKLSIYVTSKMSGVHLHDMNCGLKAYRSDVVKNIEVYGEMHCYIPVIAKWAGFTNIGEKWCNIKQGNMASPSLDYPDLSMVRWTYFPLCLWENLVNDRCTFLGIGTFISFGGLALLGWLSIEKLFLYHRYSQQTGILSGYFF